MTDWSIRWPSRWGEQLPCWHNLDRSSRIALLCAFSCREQWRKKQKGSSDWQLDSKPCVTSRSVEGLIINYSPDLMVTVREHLSQRWKIIFVQESAGLMERTLNLFGRGKGVKPGSLEIRLICSMTIFWDWWQQGPSVCCVSGVRDEDPKGHQRHESYWSVRNHRSFWGQSHRNQGFLFQNCGRCSSPTEVGLHQSTRMGIRQEELEATVQVG